MRPNLNVIMHEYVLNDLSNIQTDSCTLSRIWTKLSYAI